MHWTVQHAEVRTFSADEADAPYLSVVLAERATRLGRCMEFQLALEGPDRAEGYCLVDPGAVYEQDLMSMGLPSTPKTYYGGVRECRLTGDLLAFRFAWRARRLFGWPRTLELRLAVGEEQRAALRQGLVDVFAVGPKGRAPRVRV
jgi:pimeloyl-ACP methyl ester carboxylesterase